MIKCKLISIPIDPRVTNFLLSYDKNADNKTIKCYQSAIRSLIWPVIYTCPDIPYLVGILSWYCSNPRSTYCNLVIQIFRYLFRTLDLGITFITNPKDKHVDYTDFDYVELIDSQKSISSYIFTLPDRLLSH